MEIGEEERAERADDRAELNEGMAERPLFHPCVWNCWRR
jgi:hypothetical protein